MVLDFTHTERIQHCNGNENTQELDSQIKLKNKNVFVFS